MKKGPAIALMFSRTFPTSVILAGVALYLLGCLITFIGSGMIFLSIPPTAAIAGIVWVLSVFCLAYNKYEKLLMDLKPVMKLDGAKYDKKIQSYLRLVYDDLYPLLIFIVALFFVVFWGILPYGGASIFGFPTRLGTAYFAYVLFLGLFSSYLVSVGGYLTILHMTFVRSLMKHPIKLDAIEPHRMHRIAELGHFSLYSSLAWFGGIAVSYPAFLGVGQSYGVPSLLGVAVVGFSIFILPQVSVRNGVRREKGEILGVLGHRISNEYNKLLAGQAVDHASVGLELTFLTEVEKIKEWPVDIIVWAQLLIAAAAPALAVYVVEVLRAII